MKKTDKRTFGKRQTTALPVRAANRFLDLRRVATHSVPSMGAEGKGQQYREQPLNTGLCLEISLEFSILFFPSLRPSISLPTPEGATSDSL